MLTLCDDTVNKHVRDTIQRLRPHSQNQYKGQGIVIPGGGIKYLPCVWVCVNILRHLGCELPIQVWHLGESEMPPRLRGLLKSLDVDLVDALAVRREKPVRILNGWELKPYSIMHCSFSEVILIDADNVAVRDPTFLFNTQEYQDRGAIFWPDYGRLSRTRDIWRLMGVEYQDEPEFETGQVVVNKHRCWRELSLTMWMNEHSDYWYRHIHGDKETFHMSWRALGTEYAMPARPIFPLESTMCQHDFSGNRLFQHRNLAKWKLRDNTRIEGFMFEELCLNFIDELLSHDIEIDLLGIPKPSREVISLLGGRQVSYTRVGHETRLLELTDSGRVHGAGSRESYWCMEVDPEPTMHIYGDDGELTAKLRQTRPHMWCGAWLNYEKMPISIEVFSAKQVQCLQSDYSQWGEQLFLLSYFNDITAGYFVDIGASDGTHHSNTRALSELGWSGTLVEPVPEAYWRLEDLYANRDDVHVINAAVSNTDGYAHIWVARDYVDPHNPERPIPDNRHTLINPETVRIDSIGRPADYVMREARTISVKTLISALTHKEVDFLSIDAEGYDHLVIEQVLAHELFPALIMWEHDKPEADSVIQSLRTCNYVEVYRNKANCAWARCRD